LVTALSAAAVTVAGLVYAFTLRPPTVSEPTSSPPPSEEGLRCGSVVCRSVVKQAVGADQVEVLVGKGSGRIKVSGPSGTNIFELTIAESGAEVDDQSLQCVAGAVSVCLVRGRQGSDVVGEVLIGRAGSWSRAQVPYLSTGSNLALHDVDGDAIADVVAVQRVCDQTDCERFFAQAFSFAGKTVELGCSDVVGEVGEVPLTPTLAELHPCGRNVP
jgi:hypothetical protein